MTDSDKALYYCYTHTNLFSQRECSRCNLGMCHTCLQNHSTICPNCLKGKRQSSIGHKYKKQLLWSLGSGLVGAVLFMLYTYYGNGLIELNRDFFKGLAITFLFGVNFTAAHYFLEDNDFIERIKSFPFFGFQLALLVLIFIFLTGIPIIYFVYKMIKQRF